MRTGIRADEAPDGCGQADQRRQTLVSPAAAIATTCQQGATIVSEEGLERHVREFRKDLLGRSVFGHDPHGQKEGEEAEDVDEQDDAFSQG